MTQQHNKQKIAKIQGFNQFVAHGLLEPDAAEAITKAEPLLEAAITSDMAALLPADKATWAEDPIALQFIPALEELNVGENALDDPLGDLTHMPVKGIVHRHADRCLFFPISICAVYCRFCFRKEQIGPGKKMLSSEEVDAAMAYIAAHEEIFEVILSGGDPLMLKPKMLHDIFMKLQAIPHIKVVRIHTRIPVVDSVRMTAEMLQALQIDLPLYVVLHVNHVKELHAEARNVIKQLQKQGIHLLSQSVLLKGVNDAVEDLEQLMRELVILGVKPYYIHQLDPARGVGHFKVEKAKGLALMQALRERCSGLCQPLYVEDVPGGEGAKMPVTE